MHELNLLTDKWIRVIRADGKEHNCSYAELFDSNNPAIAVNVDEPDLRAGTLEFLVTVGQTFLAPTTEKEWRKQWQNQPTPESVNEALRTGVPYFNVIDDEKPFLQDTEVPADKKPKPIEWLVATRPPENAVKLSKDFLRRQDPEYTLTLRDAAMRLFMETAWTPMANPNGGSYRGHAPATSLLMAETLGETILINLQSVTDAPATDFLRWGPNWSRKPRAPQTEDPRSNLWQVRRTYQLDVNEGGEVKTFRSGAKSKDFAYPNSHPFSAGHIAKGKWVSQQGKAITHTIDGLLKLVTTSKKMEPADNIAHYRKERAAAVPNIHCTVFGYDASNNVDGWNEVRVPFLHYTEAELVEVQRVSNLLEAGFLSLLGSTAKVTDDMEGGRKAPDRPFGDWRNEFYHQLWSSIMNHIQRGRQPSADFKKLDGELLKEIQATSAKILSSYVQTFNPHSVIGGQVVAEKIIRLIPYNKNIKKHLAP
jgi:CRISPR type I-E-associated protein CasA/Cse1